MPWHRADDVSLRALFEALDAQRRERHLTWAAVAAEMNGGQRTPRSLAASTISNVGRRSAAEGDGVLQMLRWLDRSPESLMAGVSGAADDRYRLASPGPGRVLRWDTRALHAALDAERRTRRMSWADLARELGGGLTPATLTRLSKGGRTGFPAVMRLVRWLDRPAAAFTHVTER